MALTDDQIKQRISQALEHGGGTYELDDIVDGLHKGQFQIFWNDHGVCITEIVNGPRRSYLNCLVVAGELPGVMELQSKIDEFAHQMGCAFMMTTARLGWQKVLPQFGWDKTSVVFTRPVRASEEDNG
jgi:hypothetical protein